MHSKSHAWVNRHTLRLGQVICIVLCCPALVRRDVKCRLAGINRDGLVVVDERLATGACINRLSFFAKKLPLLLIDMRDHVTQVFHTFILLQLGQTARIHQRLASYACELLGLLLQPLLDVVSLIGIA